MRFDLAVIKFDPVVMKFNPVVALRQSACHME